MNIYRTKDLMQLLGKSRATINRMRNNGTLPPPDISEGSQPMWFRATLEKTLPGLTTNPSV